MRSHIAQNILKKYEMKDGTLKFFSDVCLQFEMFVTFYQLNILHLKERHHYNNMQL